MRHALATEVKHGLKPKFAARIIKQSSFRMSIVGYYTRTDQLTAAGVTEFHLHSDRQEKQRPELLGMRTAFVMWFLEEWVRRGGDWDEGVKALRQYPYWAAKEKLLGATTWHRVWINLRISLKQAWGLLRRR